MKWMFVLLLLGNVVYLGWEIDRDARMERQNISSAIRVPAGTPKLALLAELEKTPDKRETSKQDSNSVVDPFLSEPVMPIELNPNTRQMMDTLFTEKIPTNLNEEFPSDKIIPENTESDLDEEKVNAVCYTYGPIPDQKESELLAEWLDARGVSHRQRNTNEQGRQLFWVYLASQESRAQAEATLRDLKQKGVSDLRLIREGDLLNAISLGLFSSQAAVNRRLNEIKAKGYKAVVVPHEGNKKIHWFDVSVVQNSSYVNDLFTGFPSRFNALPVDCTEIAMQQRNP